MRPVKPLLIGVRGFVCIPCIPFPYPPHVRAGAHARARVKVALRYARYAALATKPLQHGVKRLHTLAARYAQGVQEVCKACVKSSSITLSLAVKTAFPAHQGHAVAPADLQLCVWPVRLLGLHGPLWPALS